MLKIAEFLAAYPPQQEGMILALDRRASTETLLKVTRYPASCSSQWYDLPTLIVESIQLLFMTPCSGQLLYVVSIRLKPELRSLNALIAPPTRREPATMHRRVRGCGVTAALPRMNGSRATRALDGAAELLFVWKDDFHVGDCTLQGGFNVTVRSDGTADLHAYIQSSDTNDEMNLFFTFEDPNQIPYGTPIGYYYNMDGSSCTNRWCYWVAGTTFDPVLFKSLAYLAGSAEC